MKKLRFLLGLALLVMSASPTMAQDLPFRSSCQAFPYDSGVQEVPTGYRTVLTAFTSCVTTITLINTTASPIQVRIWDGRQKLYVNQWVFPFAAPTGIPLNNIQFSGGVSWVASSSGLNAQVKALQ